MDVLSPLPTFAFLSYLFISKLIWVCVCEYVYHFHVPPPNHIGWHIFTWSTFQCTSRWCNSHHMSQVILLEPSLYYIMPQFILYDLPIPSWLHAHELDWPNSVCSTSGFTPTNSSQLYISFPSQLFWLVMACTLTWSFQKKNHMTQAYAMCVDVIPFSQLIDIDFYVNITWLLVARWRNPKIWAFHHTMTIYVFPCYVISHCNPHGSQLISGIPKRFHVLDATKYMRLLHHPPLKIIFILCNPLIKNSTL